MTTFTLHHAEAVAWARQYDGPRFHALLCDPPYHLTSITKRFGGKRAAPAKPGTDGVFQRRSAGFMHEQWDGGDVAFRPETWAAFADLLLPGGYGMAFGGSRTYHRMAVAIEDAGFELHPSIFGWAYGSGMTTPTRIDTQLEDEELAAAWQGHRYGLDTLKPALEPILVFRKPFEGKPMDNIPQTGSGAMWIDGGMLPVEDKDGGRWPPNFYLEHHPGCNGECVSDCPVHRLGQQSGRLKADSSISGAEPSEKTSNVYGQFKERRSFTSHGDDGTAARYFYNAHWAHEVAEGLFAADPVRYQAKPTRKEKEAGLEHLQAQLKHRVNPGGLENEPRFAPVEARNTHPTVKSIDLTRWLATLLLPPDQYAPRRILVPFAGVASEMCGAILAGWDEVIGVEMTAKYIPMAQGRLEFWAERQQWGAESVKQALSHRDEGPDEPEGPTQLGIFQPPEPPQEVTA